MGTIIPELESFAEDRRRAVHNLIDRVDALQRFFEEQNDLHRTMLDLVGHDQELRESLETSAKTWFKRSAEITTNAVSGYTRLRDRYKSHLNVLKGRQITFDHIREVLGAVDRNLEDAKMRLGAALRRDKLLEIDAPKKRGGVR